MIYLSNENLFEITIRSLNHVNNLLVGHGERVAYGVAKLLKQDGRFTDEEIVRIIWTVLFHDIGNFHKAAIWNLAQLENDEDDFHARYGYIFLKTFFPFAEYAPLVRYHHTSYAEVDRALPDAKLNRATKYLKLVDEADLYHVNHPRKTPQEVQQFFEGLVARQFPTGLNVSSCPFLDDADDIHQKLLVRLKNMALTPEEKRALLHTLVYSIDFRSHYTALHCSMMVRASVTLAELCGLSEHEREAVYLGAFLHDLGKIAIPVETLESPDKLDARQWEIMKSHVTITEDILRGCVSDEILQIAIRHHETLNGTGYPYGISGDQLTLPQRIVAVGDIVSALSEKRSYKPAFPIQEVMQILNDMCRAGRICPYVLQVLSDHQEEVYHTVLQAGQDIEETFERIYMEYFDLATAQSV